MNLPGKAWIALGMYLMLGVLAGFTMEGSVAVGGRIVDPRWAVWIALAGLAAKTLIHFVKLGQKD